MNLREISILNHQVINERLKLHTDHIQDSFEESTREVIPGAAQTEQAKQLRAEKGVSLYQVPLLVESEATGDMLDEALAAETMERRAEVDKYLKE